jgi:pimeloyl-ACP methyl ester carboxylesterase
MGHSIGGGIALDFAFTHPEATASLILVDSSLSGYQWPPALATAQHAVRAPARQGDMQGAQRRWMQLPIFGPLREHPAVAARLAHIIEEHSGWHWVHRNPAYVRDTCENRSQVFRAPNNKSLPTRYLRYDNLIFSMDTRGVSEKGFAVAKVG